MTYYVWARKPANSYKYGFSLKIEDNEFQNLWWLRNIGSSEERSICSAFSYRYITNINWRLPRLCSCFASASFCIKWIVLLCHCIPFVLSIVSTLFVGRIVTVCLPCCWIYCLSAANSLCCFADLFCYYQLLCISIFSALCSRAHSFIVRQAVVIISLAKTFGVECKVCSYLQTVLEAANILWFQNSLDFWLNGTVKHACESL